MPGSLTADTQDRLLGYLNESRPLTEHSWQ
jgi:hypothetical protein